MSDQAQAMQRRGDTRPVVTDVKGQLEGLLDKHRAALAKCLPAMVSMDRLARTALIQVQRTPALMKCNAGSIFGSLVQAAMCGLEIEPVTGQAYLVPFYNSKMRRFDCQFIPGYRGLVSLARRTGDVKTCYAHCVYANDDFTIEYGTDKKIVHRPAMGDRGEKIGVYACYRLGTGESDFRFLTKAEVEKVMGASESAEKEWSPWQKWEDAMWEKTAIRQLAKAMPMTIEFARAVAADERGAMGQSPDFSDVMAETGIDVPVEGRHVPDDEPEIPAEPRNNGPRATGGPTPEEAAEIERQIERESAGVANGRQRNSRGQGDLL